MDGGFYIDGKNKDINTNSREVYIMQIPFGPGEPNQQQTELLTKLGFDLRSMEKKGRYYFLSVPETPRIRCERHTPAFDKINYTLYYNDVSVITINQKTAIYDAYIYFNISTSSVDEALAKNAEISEKELGEKKSAAPKLTEYQKRLVNRLRQLEFIIFEDGADRGYGSSIAQQFPYLQDLKRENPEEHDQLILNNERYKQLFEMFPAWTDPNHLQAHYEARDVGPFVALSAASEDGTRPECCVM